MLNGFTPCHSSVPKPSASNYSVCILVVPSANQDCHDITVMMASTGPKGNQR